ncbi:MAG: hypothetical protein F4121_11490 [Acidimicrobiia bacterium]|nr:hypothetical protein [Acidimicrobiia bacterium]MYC45360.1 hypothetical protein [Acidimicrobiia bacterium]MYI20665.1 hypothetical protein [Acidimicrobiia bacterium]
MIDSPFDDCWNRLERAHEHRSALAAIWNEYLDDEPFDVSLIHEGGGVHILRVWQTTPIPAGFALELGEWLYNLRACLDYIIWATCAHVTGQMPPPDEATLQYPIYEHKSAWDNNEYRLKHLRDHHREMLLRVQPFNSDADASYLRVINRLARIDRHRRLTITTGYIAERAPVVEVPDGCQVALQWGQRLLVDGEAEMARLTVSPWTDDMTIWINPLLGIDPEVNEWAESKSWRRIPFSDRMKMIQACVAADIAGYEYDCRGTSRRSELLTQDYVDACDERGRPTPIMRKPPPDVKWTAPVAGGPGTRDRFEGQGFPSGPASPDRS